SWLMSDGVRFWLVLRAARTPAAVSVYARERSRDRVWGDGHVRDPDLRPVAGAWRGAPGPHAAHRRGECGPSGPWTAALRAAHWRPGWPAAGDPVVRLGVCGSSAGWPAAGWPAACRPAACWPRWSWRSERTGWLRTGRPGRSGWPWRSRWLRGSAARLGPAASAQQLLRRLLRLLLLPLCEPHVREGAVHHRDRGRRAVVVVHDHRRFRHGQHR